MPTNRTNRRVLHTVEMLASVLVDAEYVAEDALRLLDDAVYLRENLTAGYTAKTIAAVKNKLTDNI
jgi:hypothetical protein